MTLKIKAIGLLSGVILLSACAEQPMTPIEASRVDASALYFYNDPVDQGPVIDQVAALNQSAADLVRKSSVNGAITGAVLGCGVTVLTGGNARSCVTRAAVVGAGGAALGAMNGQRDVARRVELVAPNDVARSIMATRSQYDSIRAALPDFLARQEAELNRLAVQFANNEIDKAYHDRAVSQIILERGELAAALDMSARDARRASENLQIASRRGQADLEWHIEATAQLADDVQSTRSTFSLL